MDAGRTFAGHLDRYRFACVDNRCVVAHRIPGVGLAIAIPGECSARYLRSVDQARRRRDASLSRTGSKAAQVTSTNQRDCETTLARLVARNWCAYWARCLVFVSGGFFTELFVDDPRLAQATCVGFVVNRPRVQRPV